MRLRAQTSSSCEHLDFEQPQFLREQYKKTKLQLSILTQKNESLQKQIGILKQGNTNLISQFLFNKHRQELNRLYRQLAEKTKENNELKQIIVQLEDMVKNATGGSKELKKFQSIKKFSIKLENDTQITANKESSIGHQLKVELRDLLDNYKKLAKGSSIFNVLTKDKEKVKDKEQNANKQRIKSLQSQRDKLKSLTEWIQKQLKSKITQLSIQNSNLKQKISLMTSLARQKQMKPILRFNDYPIPLTASMCNTQELKKSIIYDRLSESAVMRSSVVTESYDKKINKLERTNSILEKDYQASKEKIKTLTQENSKLKLNYLKVEQDKKRSEENYERKTSGLNDKLQALNRKIKDLQILNEKTKSQKNKQTQSYENIISQHQSKIVQLEQKLQKNSIEILHLKEQVEVSKKNQQKQTLYLKQLENEKQKCKQLEKELEQRVINFQKSLKNYEKIIDEMRKMNNNVGKQGRKIESQQPNRSRSKQSSTPKQSSFLSPSQSSLLLTLRQQITILQSTIATQNERYNILENSNKELRQRLVKMIENEEKLRKQLLQERIKSRTNKSVSQSSKYSRAGSIRKINLAGEANSRYEDHNEYESQKKLQQLKINAVQSQNQQTLLTNRNSSSYIQSYKTLTQNSSNRQFKSQTVIVVNKEQGKGSQMKLLRQRRFDPKETLQTKKKPNQKQFVVNQQNYEPSYGKVEIEKYKGKNAQSNNTTSSPKYTYQPPKSKHASQNQFSPLHSHSPQIPTSQPQSESKQISFEISQSQSNLSKGDKIIQLLQINENSSLEDSPCVRSFGESYYGSRYSGGKEEHTGTGKFSDLCVGKKDDNNFVTNGVSQHETKSNGDVRFTRKY